MDREKWIFSAKNRLEENRSIGALAGHWQKSFERGFFFNFDVFQ